MAGNDDLHPILKRIHQTLGDILTSVKEIRGDVKKVYTAVTEGAEAIVDAVHDSIQAQAEMKMMERVAEVREIRPQITAEQERIESEQEELNRQLDRIAERYERKHNELDEKAASRIRDVGAHIFELDEEQFEDGIEQPFTEHVTATWQTLQSQNEAVREQRRDRVESTTGEVVGKIHEFVDHQNELVNRIERTRTKFDRSLSDPVTMQVPYYVVTVERDGKTEQRVIRPSQVADNDGPVSASLQSLPGMDRLVSHTGFNRGQVESLDGDAVRNQLDQYISRDKPLLSYGGLIEDTVDDEGEIAVEGGS